jgi:DNA-binding HxlR family transcriptional regulator
MLKKFILLSLSIALCACATSENYTNQLNKEIGQTSQQLIGKYGQPSKVKKLEDGKWISRERSVHDRRHFVLKLTEKGEGFIPVLYEINKDWETRMGLNDLDPEFMKTFSELTLKSIDLNLKK